MPQNDLTVNSVRFSSDSSNESGDNNWEGGKGSPPAPFPSRPDSGLGGFAARHKSSSMINLRVDGLSSKQLEQCVAAPPYPGAGIGDPGVLRNQVSYTPENSVYDASIGMTEEEKNKMKT